MKLILPLLLFYISATTSYIKAGFWMSNPTLSLRPQHSLTSSVSLHTMTNGGSDEYLKTLSIRKIMNTNIINRVNETECDQINITSVYLNIDKVNAVYFAKNVKNVIFTSPYNLADLYYYDKDEEVIYKISNKTRINLKSIDRFVFQSFNNNIDGILF